MVRRKPELWDPEQIAEYLGFAGEHAEATARKTMERWQIAPIYRVPGKHGKNQYPAEAIRKKDAERPRPRKPPKE